jgi:hypothetical protein
MIQDNATSRPDPAPDAASPRRRRRVLVMVAFGMVILISGIAIGSGGTVIWMHHRMMRAFHDPDRMEAELAARIRSELDLTDEQTARVEQVLKERRKAMDKLHEEMSPKFEAERERLRTEVAAVLNSEQARKWNEDFDKILPMPPQGPPIGPPGEPPPRR